MSDDYLKYWIVEDHQTTLNLTELWKWTGKKYTDYGLLSWKAANIVPRI